MERQTPERTGRDERGGRGYERVGLWMAIGIGVGTAVGAALEQLPIGIALGASLGTAVGVAVSGKSTR
jgi:hypothetical protein